MKGYAFVDIEALQIKKKVDYWINLALGFNKIAKASKPKKKSKVVPRYSDKILCNAMVL